MERNLTEVGHVCVLIIREMGAGVVAEERRRGGEEESFKNILIDPIVIIVVIVIKLNSFLIEVNLLGHLAKPWQY